MPRQPRLFPPGSILHIISRGNRRQAIFELEADWDRFKSSLLLELEKGGILALAYCLMPNHFHLIARGVSEALSLAMHNVLTSHAVYMNKKYGRVGHLFGGRFKAFLCPPERLKPLVRYVHQNPVRAKLVRSADDWAWSSHRGYLDPSSKTPPGKSLVLSHFDEDADNAIASYRKFMTSEESEDKIQEGTLPPLEALCAKAERDGGHAPGVIKQRSQRRDISGARKRFILSAFAAGHRPGAIARFLGLAPSAVSRYRQESRRPTVKSGA